MTTIPLARKEKLISLGYEIVMAVLALAVLVLLLAEFIIPLNKRQLIMLTQLELVVVFIFAADYFIRLYKAENKIRFIRGNLLDLVAILPVDNFLRISRVTMLAEFHVSDMCRIFKFSRVARILVFTRKFFSGFFKLVKTNGLHYMVAFTTGIIFIGAFGIQYFEKPYGTITNFGDALWWSLVTTTTVGYGDLAPVTAGGRILAAFLMIAGIGFIGMVTGSIATFFLNRMQPGTEAGKKSVADEEIEYIKHKLDDLESLSQEDVLTLNKVILGIWEQKSVLLHERS
ncbi:MAG: ion transporter [Bacillota bacterium]|nr:ion transporter [Bacillota bacterium]MDW7683116.1 ion transporter [Bacillota bacterium]